MNNDLFTSNHRLPSQSIQQHERASTTHLKQLSSLLRLGGTVAILGGTIAFLGEPMSRLNELSSLLRYTYFMMLSIGLGTIGLFCGQQLKEHKSARTFLGVTAALLPAHFCQLGGFIYKSTNGGGFAGPDIFQMSSLSTITLCTVIITAVPLLLTITYLSFSIFDRTRKKKLYSSYVSICLLLLLPLRSPSTVVMLAGAGSYIAFRATRNSDRQELARTKESLLLSVMVWTPLLVLPVRTLINYNMNQQQQIFTMLLECFIGWILLRTILAEQTRSETLKKSILTLSSITGIVCSILMVLLSTTYIDSFFSNWHTTIHIAAISLVAAPWLIRWEHDHLKHSTEAALLLSIIHLFLSFSGYSLISAGIGLTSAIVLTVLKGKFSFSMCIGLTTIALSIIQFALCVFGQVTIGLWILLAVVGTILVLGSAFIEKNHYDSSQTLE